MVSSVWKDEKEEYYWGRSKVSFQDVGTVLFLTGVKVAQVFSLILLFKIYLFYMHFCLCDVFYKN